ncbi:phosphatidylinositol 4-phosphate 5-kinase 9 [Selaginella moellendorffii]|uniref:phosphatidylinositol 4-phosphate 5-kinase 9 n=1 Tax=Selaginella moellendorffii TaxID=88036 RepID=UPI000D1D038E|nr:phosphatidylinositol 4-phosphate 5-kinase 9 [Selaginella moellendorffii]|eukprot:XP_024528312.1 phosphatidylinositol 4-phosphate 5-kinase 9 [Selaginella moellendorffii]
MVFGKQNKMKGAAATYVHAGNVIVAKDPVLEFFQAPKRKSSVVPEFENDGDLMPVTVEPSQMGLHNQESIEVSGSRSDFCESSTSGRGEKNLSNGDFYAGSFEGGIPEGDGKYLWSDGCMYEGQWGKGKKTGRGKISWPSGATYEGDFMCGYMHGSGTFTGTDGTTYKGSWKMNLKNGLGRKRYANGDVYEGSWKDGAQEGPGRYVWANGNEYMGDWKGGLMCGRGVLTWASGDCYDGQWLDGLENGHGVYTWSDGTVYNGNWSKGLKDGKGVYYPPGSFSVDTAGFDRNATVGKQVAATRRNRAPSLDFDQAIRQQHDFGPMKSYSAEQTTLEKALQADSAERIFDSEEYHGADPVVEREYVQGVLINEIVKKVPANVASTPKSTKRRYKKHVKEIKRPGETIIKGHRSYDLMLNLQLGIRYTVGKITPEPKHDIEPSNFGRKARFRMNFPRAGSQLTPSHQSVDFKWKDYCPMVFRHLRELFKIDAADYMLSLCGNDALRELSSPGKSGSVFYLSHDDRFIIKTMRKSEVEVLLDMLASYYDHVLVHENTLITKFFGLHRIKPQGGRKVRFVVMGNMFCTDLRIHRRFDLKGSSLGRSTENVDIDENTTLKDLDLDFVFHLEPTWRDTFMRQIELDAKFLESQRIMDYSLLLGVHFRAPQYPAVFSPVTFPKKINKSDIEEDWPSKSLVLVAHGASPTGESGATTPGSHVRGSPLKPAGNEEVDLLLPGTARLRIQLGVNMPARADREAPHDGGQEESFGEVYDVVLYFGVIDILQRYDITKWVEHTYKSLQFDAVSISAVDPSMYAKRFQDFIEKVFPR